MKMGELLFGKVFYWQKQKNKASAYTTLVHYVLMQK
jgi:hypothetical protein